MSKDSTLVRQWLLLKTLSSRRYGVTVQEMAQELDVNQKTIRRDLNTFKSVGLPLEETVADHGQKKWAVKVGNGQPEMHFNMDEGLALYMGRRFLEPMAGTLLWEAAQSAFKKIRACLGKEALAYLEKMAGNLHHTAVGVSDYSKKADLIDELMEGIEKHKATIINYQSLSATEPVEHEVYPYGLTYHRGSLYLIARPSDRQKMLHFKVDRIEDAVAGPFTFEPPEDFNVHDHLADSFGVFQGDGKIAIKVRFLPRVAPYVLESKWHDSQKLTKQKDGSVLAEFLLSNTEEIKRWILSFGQHAVVIEPELLRQEMNEELNGMQRLYSGPKRASHPSKQPKEGQPASEFKAETSAMR
jgi:proteasome accessory factor B